MNRHDVRTVLEAAREVGLLYAYSQHGEPVRDVDVALVVEHLRRQGDALARALEPARCVDCGERLGDRHLPSCSNYAPGYVDRVRLDQTQRDRQQIPAPPDVEA